MEENISQSIEKENKPEKTDYMYSFQKILDALKRAKNSESLTDEEKKQIVGEIHYYMDYMLYAVKNENELTDLLTHTVNEIGGTDFENMIRNQILNGIQEHLNERIRQTPQTQEKVVPQRDDLASNIAQLKSNLKRLQTVYHDMLHDSRIDTDELSALINKMKSLYRNAEDITRYARTSSEKEIIFAIMDDIDNETRKMMEVQRRAEEISKHTR